MLSTVAATLRMPVQLVELLELLIRYVVLFVSYYLQVQRYWAVLPKLGRGYQMRKKTVAALAKPQGYDSILLLNLGGVSAVFLVSLHDNE